MPRIEVDSLGEMEVPDGALYGAATARAMINFPISGLRVDSQFLWSTLKIKAAAATVNSQCGLFHRIVERDSNAFQGKNPNDVVAAITQAANEIASDILDGAVGRYLPQFVVDVFQAGAGTSHNMNVNEVVANRAIQILGGRLGDRALVDPNDHVNMSQSTNDVVPTAMRLAALRHTDALMPALDKLVSALAAKGAQFNDIVKSGRTHLQDAVPIRLGSEFRAWSATISRCRDRIWALRKELQELGIGGNAVGTGINAPSDFAKRMCAALEAETGLTLRSAPDLIECCQNTDVYVTASAALRTLALDLIRICNDLRLLASGPHTGLAEIEIPPVQPGSSIMPGKVNPVMAEMMTMVCFQIMGNDTAIAIACQAGQLELNVMMPVIAHNLFTSYLILTNALTVFSDLCVEGISANRVTCNAFLERSSGLGTILNPLIGYLNAAAVVKRAEEEGASIKSIAVDMGLMTEEEFDRAILEALR